MSKIKIGIVSTRDKSFIGDAEGFFNKSIESLKESSVKLGFELYIVSSPVYTDADAKKAVEECEKNNVDFLLVQITTCSGGTLIPIFAGITKARLGIWAIPEGATKGPSPFNSFVGMTFYAGIIGHYVKEHDVKFKWFYGDAEDKMFKNRFSVTVKALDALKKLCSSKVALIGGVSNGFGDLYFDERSIKKRFKGIDISQYNEYREIRDKALGFKASQVEKVSEDFVNEAKCISEQCRPYVEANARIYMAYKEFIDEYNCDALALNCIYKLQEDFKTNLCAVIGKLNDDGTVVACEGDLMGALSMLLLKYLTGSETTLMDFPQFDENDNSILMWHCGSTAKCFAQNECFTLQTSYSGMPIVRDLSFKPEHVTIARIAGEADKIFIADGKVIKDKESFTGSSGWIGDVRLNREKISAIDFVNTVLVNKFHHHYPVAFGDVTNEINEIASWISMGHINEVKYEDYFQDSIMI